jgi:tyrosine-protein phosphatase YwqE
MGIFNKNRKSYSDFAQIKTDLHSHILPGIDDGAATIGESVKIIRQMYDLGYRKIITTPHVISNLYPNTSDTILGQLSHLQEVVQLEGIPMELEASGEYHMDQLLIEKVRKGEVIPFGGEKYLLVELPFEKPAFSVKEVLIQIQSLGYKPIIAHPERYFWFIGKMKFYEELKMEGMLFQLNLNSLTGVYGFPIKMTANQLVDAGMIDFVGSDTHHAGHLQELVKVLNNKYFDRLLQSGKLLNSNL